jgi:hypothetical protein
MAVWKPSKTTEGASLSKPNTLIWSFHRMSRTTCEVIMRSGKARIAYREHFGVGTTEWRIMALLTIPTKRDSVVISWAVRKPSF